MGSDKVIDRAVDEALTTMWGDGYEGVEDDVREAIHAAAPLLVEHGRQQERKKWEARIEDVSPSPAPVDRDELIEVVARLIDDGVSGRLEPGSITGPRDLAEVVLAAIEEADQEEGDRG